MGIGIDFLVSEARLSAYQYSDFIFNVEVADIDNELLITPATDFLNAEYLIADDKGNVIVRKSLGDGITVSGDYFRVHVEDAEMTFLGPCTHQFVVYASNGDKLPPVFYEPLKIIISLI